MADYTAMRFDQMEPIFDGMFLRARASLGVESFGMQILQMSPENANGYPNHDHSHDGQEEVYVILEGSADFEIEGARVAAEPNMAIRVGPDAKRKILPGADGVRILALGGVPAGTYKPPEFTNLGGPEPGPGQ